MNQFVLGKLPVVFAGMIPSFKSRKASNTNLTKHALTSLLAFGVVLAHGDEPLSVKGVALGDTIDKMGQLTTCTMARGGMCMGTASYVLAPTEN
jgi:hypothetical protein